MKHFVTIVTLTWVFSVIASFSWNSYQKHTGMLESALIQARIAFQKDVLYRKWNSMQGSVYIKITEKTPPNPYLNIPERDVETTSGQLLTLINPAYMTRQIHELQELEHGIKSHITSLKPIRPENRADAWETIALKEFESGTTEISDLQTIEGEDYMRLMRPLPTEKACLKCHSDQGYKEGDIRGGISVSVPMAPLQANLQKQNTALAVGHGGLLVLGLLGIWMTSRREGERIRERDLSEKELAKSKEHSETIIESALDAVVEMDASGCITAWNPQAEIVFGWSASEAIGKPLSETIIPPQYREAHRKGLMKFLQTKEQKVLNKRFEISALHQDGREFPVELTVNPIEKDDSYVFNAFLRDITERKQAEEKLRNSEQEYRTLAHNIPGMIYRGNPDWSAKIFSNPEHLSGYSLDEFNSEKVNWSNIIHPDDQQSVYEENRIQLTEKPREIVQTYRIVSKNGAIRWVEDHKTLLFTEEGTFSGVDGVVFDITGRKMLEEALISSQQKLLIHVEQTHLAILEYDIYFKVVAWNPAAERIFGYTKKEALGCHIGDLIVPEQAKSHVDRIWEALINQNGGEHSINENITKKGKSIICEWYNTPLVDKNGIVIGVASLAKDITEHKQAEKELRLTKYSIDNSSSAALWIRQDGHIHYANKACVLMTGYSLRELSSMYLWDFNSDFSEETFGIHWQALEKKSSITFESVYTRKDGQQITVEVNTNLHDFESEKYIFAYVLDITERKKSEMEQTRLVKAVEQSNDNIVITDLEGNIEYVNPTFERNTGYSRTEVFGQNPRILKSGKHDDGFYRNIWENIISGRIWTGNIINKRKDGKLVEEYASIFPVQNSDGEITNFVGVKRDMTEQNNMEKQLRQAQKLEAVGTLAGGIAHDFNNILSAIFSYTQLSKSKLPDPSEHQKVTGYLDMIFSAGMRAKELVDQILTFSRKGDFDPQKLDLHSLVKESIRFLRATIPTTISIKLNADSDLNSIYGDATQIQQVILNLCANAAHAMEEKGGNLDVTVSNYELRQKTIKTRNLDPGEYLLITVSDTGKGMNDETKQRIFEPFFTTKEKGKGTGLGLSSVHGIVTKHGGTINVYSQEGFGTIFNVFLPAGKDSTQKSTNEIETELPTGSESILFVDDETSLCEAYGEILKSQGFQTQTATSSRDALNHFIKNPEGYDLVITDYTMPEMNGVELSREIHKYNRNVPVILVSGLGQLMLDQDLKSVGIVARYSKPVEIGTLLRGVRDILDNK